MTRQRFDEITDKILALRDKAKAEGRKADMHGYNTAEEIVENVYSCTPYSVSDKSEAVRILTQFEQLKEETPAYITALDKSAEIVETAYDYDKSKESTKSKRTFSFDIEL